MYMYIYNDYDGYVANEDLDQDSTTKDGSLFFRSCGAEGLRSCCSNHVELVNHCFKKYEREM